MDFTQADILKATEVGTWLIRLDPEGGRNEMYADSTMLHILDAPADLSPQECYEHWYSRIGQEYYEVVNEYQLEDLIRIFREYGENRTDCTAAVYMASSGNGRSKSQMYGSTQGERQWRYDLHRWVPQACG